MAKLLSIDCAFSDAANQVRVEERKLKARFGAASRLLSTAEESRTENIRRLAQARAGARRESARPAPNQPEAGRFPRCQAGRPEAPRPKAQPPQPSWPSTHAGSPPRVPAPPAGGRSRVRASR